MMCAAIDNPISCEIHTVMHFLHAKNMTAVEIHHELCAVHGQNIMSEGAVSQWCRIFKDGQINVHDEERGVWPSIASDGHVQIERWCFTISEPSYEF
jgi:hypothetical protein